MILSVSPRRKRVTLTQTYRDLERQRDRKLDRNRYIQRDMQGGGWGDKEIAGDRRDKRRHSNTWKIEPYRECERERD